MSESLLIPLKNANSGTLKQFSNNCLLILLLDSGDIILSGSLIILIIPSLSNIFK